MPYRKSRSDRNLRSGTRASSTEAASGNMETQSVRSRRRSSDGGTVPYGWGTWLMIVLLTLLTLSYFCVQGYNYFADPFSTTLAYSYSVEESMEANGYVVREEQVLPDAPGAYLRLRRGEGERVSAGGTVATVYRDQDSLEMQTQIDTLTARLEQLRYAKESAMGVEVTSRLDSQIFQNILLYASALASDRLDKAEERGAQLRTQILKRDYTHDSPESIDSEIAELESRLETLGIQSARVAWQITAPVSGLYSAVTDGYEDILTPRNVRNLAPSELAALVGTSGNEETAQSESVGKLVTGDVWYYIAVLTEKDMEEVERHIISGDALSLRFSKGLERDFPVTLENVGPQENGRVTALFRCDRYLSEVTIPRHQKAQIVFGTVTGLRVPKEALRILTQTVEPLEENAPDTSAEETSETDSALETSETPRTWSVTQTITGSQTMGLYCVLGTQARFKPVKVLYTGENFLLVESAVSSGSETLRLRSGDEVIIQAEDLYDGKVVLSGG